MRFMLNVLFQNHVRHFEAVNVRSKMRYLEMKHLIFDQSTTAEDR